MEEWRDIINFEGFYQVSNQGRVRSLDRTFSNSIGKVVTHYGRLLKPYVHWKGYLEVQLHRMGKRSKFKVHRLVAAAFLPNPLDLPQVDHKDRKKTNNYDSNLEWVTGAENINRYQQYLEQIRGCTV